MKKVLIIETEDAVRTSIRELLEANNFTVFSASEGKEGFKLAEKIIPDIIICNITMSKIDGFEEISKLKSKPAFNHTPFIFLTAKAEITDLRFGTERDTYDYITKPFRVAALLNAVNAKLEKCESFVQKGTKNAAAENKEDKFPLAEEDKIFINISGKPQMIKIGDIVFIKALGGYSEVCLTSGEKLSIHKLLKNWEDLLPENAFLRIHRSIMVNMNHIQKIEKCDKKSYKIFLRNTEEKFIISQRYSIKIKSKFFV